jgi:uncharacterized RDD family membrane protein YckC
VIAHHTVLTPEKICVTFPYATLGQRIGAQILDLCVVGMLLGASSQLLGLLGAVGQAILAASFLVIFLGYFLICEGLFRGQTLGKRAMGIRVIMSDGSPVTWKGASLRNLIRLGDFLPAGYFFGLVAMTINPRSQRLGDLAADTLVVESEKSFAGFMPSPHRAGIHPFEEHIGDVSRVSMAEYQAIKRLCDRFPDLTAPIQDQCLRTIWDPFAKYHGIQPIRNVHPIYLMEAVIMKVGRLRKLV